MRTVYYEQHHVGSGTVFFFYRSALFCFYIQTVLWSFVKRLDALTYRRDGSIVRRGVYLIWGMWEGFFEFFKSDNAVFMAEPTSRA